MSMRTCLSDTRLKSKIYPPSLYVGDIRLSLSLPAVPPLTLSRTRLLWQSLKMQASQHHLAKARGLSLPVRVCGPNWLPKRLSGLASGWAFCASLRARGDSEFRRCGDSVATQKFTAAPDFR